MAERQQPSTHWPPEHNRLALRNEHRFVSMALLEGEFLEGIRAALIDRSPRWRYPSHDSVPQALIQRLLQPARDGAPDLSGALSQTERT